MIFCGAVAFAFHPLAHGFMPPQLAIHQHRFGLVGVWFWQFSPRLLSIAAGLAACAYWTERTWVVLVLAPLVVLGVMTNGVRQLVHAVLAHATMGVEVMGVAVAVTVLQIFARGGRWQSVIRRLRCATLREGLRPDPGAIRLMPRALPGPLVRLRIRDLALAIAVLFAVGVIELNHARMYGTTEASLWHWAIEGFFFRGRILEAGLLSALVLALVIVLGGRRSCLHLRHDRDLPELHGTWCC